MKKLILVCNCDHLEHQIVFWYDEEFYDLYIEPHLVTHKSFIKRLWVGLKYAMGYKGESGEFDSIILGLESQRILARTLVKNLKASK